MNDDVFLFSGWDRDGEIAMDRLLRDIPLKINCVSIGRIENVYDQMADVSIIYKRDSGLQFPMLEQVPLLVMQGGGKFIKFPVAKGDKCLLLFCDRDISRWHARGEERQMPPSERAHNLSDAIAICGLNYMGRGLGEDNYKGEDGKPAIQINGKGNHFVKYNELEKTLKEFSEDLKAYIDSGIVDSIGKPLTYATILFPELNIESAKSIGIETGSYEAVANVSLERTQEELEQMQISKLGIDNLKAMYKLLNEAKGDDDIGILLRNLWNKYEDKLRVHDINYGSASDIPMADKDVSGEYGIFINLNRDVKKTDYLNEYQQIFHEFFHCIDFIAGNTFTWSYKPYAFANTIKADVEAIGYFNDMQQSTAPEDIRKRAYLFDILGGVLNRDKIGTLDGKGKEFGHDNDYWEKDIDVHGEIVYLARIAAETFANMASSAITNIDAFNLMKDKLPNAYKMFIDILKKMIEK